MNPRQVNLKSPKQIGISSSIGSTHNVFYVCIADALAFLCKTRNPQKEQTARKKLEKWQNKKHKLVFRVLRARVYPANVLHNDSRR
jgi:hypothetical protein